MERGMELMVVTDGFHSSSDSMSSTDISHGNEPLALAYQILSGGIPLSWESWREREREREREAVDTDQCRE